MIIRYIGFAIVVLAISLVGCTASRNENISTTNSNAASSNTAKVNANAPGPPVVSTPMSEDVFVRISFQEETKGNPIVVGETNLPDGTQLSVSIQGKTTNFNGGDKATVKGGKFQTVPFGPVGGLKPGQYTASLGMAMASLQPDSVQAVIGKNGEHLKGPLVTKGALGPGIDVEEGFQVTASGIVAKKGNQSEVASVIKEAKEILQALRTLEQQGRSMEPLRNSDDASKARQCGDLMRQRMQTARDLATRAEKLPTQYGFQLAVAAREFTNCVVCHKSAISSCDMAHKTLVEAEKAIKGN